MTEELASVITQLEQRKTAIDRALAALREAEGNAVPDTALPLAATTESSTRKGKKLTAAVRKRMKEAQQLRWAKTRSESQSAAPAAPEPPKPKRKISAEGMKRIIAATKKRWALKRAEAKAALGKVRQGHAMAGEFASPGGAYTDFSSQGPSPRSARSRAEVRLLWRRPCHGSCRRRDHRRSAQPFPRRSWPFE